MPIQMLFWEDKTTAFFPFGMQRERDFFVGEHSTILSRTIKMWETGVSFYASNLRNHRQHMQSTHG